MFLNIHTHLAQNELAVQNVIFGKDKIGHSPFSIGVHPWYLPPFSQEFMESLEQYVQDRGCVLIGECGLDSTTPSSLNDQEDWFLYQIHLSEKFGKPLLLHIVKQYDRVIAIHQKHKVRQPWIVHGFHKNQKVADNCLRAGFYLSFGSALLQAKSLQAIFKTIPLEKIFLETDDSSSSIEEVYQKAAEIRGIDVHSLAEKINENWNTIHLK